MEENNIQFGGEPMTPGAGHDILSTLDQNSGFQDKNKPMTIRENTTACCVWPKKARCLSRQASQKARAW